MMPPPRPPDLHAWLDQVEAQWARALGEEDMQHRHCLMFELGRTDLPLAVQVIRGLVEALQFYAADMNWQNDAVDIGVGMQPIPGTAEIDHDSGRVAQEALANALQEARDG